MIDEAKSEECPVCGEAGKTFLMEKRLNLFSCGNCSHTFTVNPKRVEDYGEKYFTDTHKNWFENENKKLFDFICAEAKRLAEKKEIRLLDIGCGNGAFLKHAAEKNPKAELHGIDLIENSYPGINFIKGDFLKARIGKKFDAATAITVIAHIGEPKKFAGKLNSLLKPGGIAFITTVNTGSLLYRTARALNRLGFRKPFDRVYDFHHLNHYSNHSLKTLMEGNGFRVLSQKNHGHPLKALDVPAGGIVSGAVYMLSVYLIFILAGPLGMGKLQTIVCRKAKSTEKAGALV